MHRTIIMTKWSQKVISNKLIPKRPHTCHITRPGRMHSKYHKDITPSSMGRLRRYIDQNMIETVRSHENFIKYETRPVKITHKPEIKLLKADDWEALVIDGKLLDEGHSFRANDILELLKNLEIIDYDYKDYRGSSEEDYYEDDVDKYRSKKQDDEIF